MLQKSQTASDLLFYKFSTDEVKYHDVDNYQTLLTVMEML